MIITKHINNDEILHYLQSFDLKDCSQVLEILSKRVYTAKIARNLEWWNEDIIDALIAVMNFISDNNKKNDSEAILIIKKFLGICREMFRLHLEDVNPLQQKIIAEIAYTYFFSKHPHVRFYAGVTYSWVYKLDSLVKILPLLKDPIKLVREHMVFAVSNIIRIYGIPSSATISCLKGPLTNIIKNHLQNAGAITIACHIFVLMQDISILPEIEIIIPKVKYPFQKESLVEAVKELKALKKTPHP